MPLHGLYSPCRASLKRATCTVREPFFHLRSLQKRLHSGAAASNVCLLGHATPRRWYSCRGSTAESEAGSAVRISQQPRQRAQRVVVVVSDSGDGPQMSSIEPQASDVTESQKTAFFQERIASSKKFFARVFLPVGFPSAVTDNYFNFVQFAALQMFFSHVSRVLSTQAMLLALGIGAKSALPVAAVTAWILKDGLGHICAIVLGTFVNTRFDSDPKRFRFYAAVLGKTADIISVFTLARPELFLLFSTIGCTFGRMSQTTIMSCRAKIYETFARKDNLGDISRCSQAQTTAAQLLGTAGGACLGPLVGADIYRLLFCSGFLSVAALCSAYKASNLVQMSTLNIQRAELTFQQAVADIVKLEANTTLVTVLPLPDPFEVRSLEVFVSPYRSVIADVSLIVNPLMKQLVPTAGYTLLVPSGGLQSQPYTFAVKPITGERHTCIAMWFHEGVRPPEVIRGFFHSCLLRAMLASGDYSAQELHGQTELMTKAWWPKVEVAMEAAGWRRDVAFLDAAERRITIL